MSSPDGRSNALFARANNRILIVDDSPSLHDDYRKILARTESAELAAAEAGPVKGERLAEAQDIPLQFLEHILLELKHAGIVRARRGAKGGYWLARPPGEIALADIIRAIPRPVPPG